MSCSLKRLLLTSMAVIGLIGLTACSGVASRLRPGDERERHSIQQRPLTDEEQATQRRHFAVQVMGVQWVNPVMRRSYPTQWNLLWALGVAKTDSDDYGAKHNASYQPRDGTLPAVTAIAVNDLKKLSFANYFEGYLLKALNPYRVPYFVNNNGFYSIKKDGSHRTWYDVSVWFAGSSEGNPKTLEEIVGVSIYDISDGVSRKFNPEDKHPTVHVVQGVDAGFRSLSSAMDYLEANPDKTAWVMAMDAPDYPKYKQTTENCVLLILANANRPNERLPLALIHRVDDQPLAQFQNKPQASAAHQAWTAALAGAAEHGNKTLADVGMTFIDTGRGQDKTRRLTAVSQALTQTQSDVDVKMRLFDMTARIGDGQAAMSVVNLAMGIAYSHERNKPVLVTDTADPAAAHAVLITPPPGHVAPDPNRRFSRATGEGRAYWPWWGARRDGRAGAYD